MLPKLKASGEVFEITEIKKVNFPFLLPFASNSVNRLTQTGVIGEVNREMSCFPNREESRTW